MSKKCNRNSIPKRFDLSKWTKRALELFEEQQVSDTGKHQNTKVSIIGAGMVGSTLAYSLVMAGTAGEVLLVDIDKDRAEGEVMDLRHTLPFGAPARIWSGSYEDCAGSDVIVITAGKAQKRGESRLSLAKENVKVIKDISAHLQKSIENTMVIIVTNPVDVLTYAFIKSSGLPSSRVFGSGTILDSARLRYELSEHCLVDSRNVHGYIIGEHGDSEMPLWSLANIAGVRLSKYCLICGKGCPQSKLNAIFEDVKTAAYRIINKKGAAYFAIAMGTLRLIEAVLRNHRSVFTVSVLLQGQLGLRDVCLSLPCIVGGEGIERVIELPLEESEERRLHASAKVIKEAIKKVSSETDMD